MRHAATGLGLCLLLSAVDGPALSSVEDHGARDPVLERAAEYVRRYQKALTSVIAVEEYSQQVEARYPPDPRLPRSRTLESDVFFLYVPGYDWMTIRDVLEVDGEEVAQPGRVAARLTRENARALAVQFKRENSRFNIGRAFRNFNEPTLALLVLDDRYRRRFSFERVRAETRKGRTVATFEFEETAEPTLVRELSGGNAFASGDLTVDVDSGRVLRTSLYVAPDGVEMTLTTEYDRDPRLGMYVPVRFGEHYVTGLPPQELRPLPGARQAQRRFRSFYEKIVCEATYRDYRRFEVKTRIR